MNLLFRNCVRLRPTGEVIPGHEHVQPDWPHSLPGVERGDRTTAYLIRTDAGVEAQYAAWLRDNWREAA